MWESSSQQLAEVLATLPEGYVTDAAFTLWFGEDGGPTEEPDDYHDTAFMSLVFTRIEADQV